MHPTHKKVIAVLVLVVVLIIIIILWAKGVFKSCSHASKTSSHASKTSSHTSSGISSSKKKSNGGLFAEEPKNLQSAIDEPQPSHVR